MSRGKQGFDLNHFHLIGPVVQKNFLPVLIVEPSMKDYQVRGTYQTKAHNFRNCTKKSDFPKCLSSELTGLRAAHPLKTKVKGPEELRKF